MSDDATNALIERLGRELRPVRPIARLRTVLGIALALAALAAAARFAFVSPRADLAHLLDSSLAFASIGAALALLAGGAAVVVTASSVPGRERVAAIGGALGIGGVVLAAGVAPLCARLVASDPMRLPGSVDLGCAIAGILVGALPAAWLIGFARRAAPRRLDLATAIGVGAGVAAGSLAIHASCPAPGAWHWVFGHAAPPLLAGTIAGALAALVRRARS